MVKARRLLLALGLVAAACAPYRPASRTPPPRVLAAALSGMIWPLPIRAAREVTSPYGERGRRHHDGLDIDGRTGDPIHAAREGRVAFSGWMRGYGNTIVLAHDQGVTTLYGHASRLLVAAGDRVARGQPIALVGATGDATGDHLHFEVAWAGVPLDPDPLLPAVRPR